MKPLKILHYTFCRTETGMGHFFRSLALAQTAIQRGHTVFFASDRTPPYPFGFILTAYRDKFSLISALQLASPDWLIVDMPDPLPEWLRELADEAGCKICTLNGIGYNQNGDGADLRVIQGLESVDLPGEQNRVPVIKGVEYIILRPELAKYLGEARGEETMVWGGAADVMKLHQRYFAACPGRFAVHIISDMIAPPILNTPTQTYLRLKGDESIFGWLASSKALVCAFGMITWEAAFLGLPIFSFSATELHLHFALAMERAGLIRTWPGVGLPGNDDDFRAFISEDWQPTGERPTLDGAVNVMKAIENY
jgi:spore coat polysaccharide biosynthesis predicted glycosyltransferase SpsG